MNILNYVILKKVNIYHFVFFEYVKKKFEICNFNYLKYKKDNKEENYLKKRQ